ncbi:MAG TPA: ROK family protein [Planctomycetota bacterium]|nr:ROK family protein [Planctomycetota bacterium]
MSGKKGLILGLELSGNKVSAAIVNPYHKIIGRASRTTPSARSEGVLTDEIITCAEDALKAASVTDKDIQAVGMGCPGPLNPETGVIIRTRRSALKNYPVGQILAKHFGVRVTIDNNVHMAVYGEFRAGAALGCRNVVGLWIGSSIGGCVIRDGEVVLGANRNAGDVGHMVLDASLRMKDPRRGTFDSECSKAAMERFVKRALKKGKKSKLRKYIKGPTTKLKNSDLAKAFEKGDEVAATVVQHSARYCGIAVANLFNVLSPEVFILGGSVVTKLGDAYVARVQRAAAPYVYSTDLAPVRIVRSRLGNDAGVLGAAIAAWDRS